MNRPPFSKNLSAEEFKKYYWYKTELQTICKNNNLPYQGTKAELQNNIINFLRNKECINNREKCHKIRTNTKQKEITLDIKIIEDGFKLNNEARLFFENYFNVKKFHFSKSMAAFLRNVEKEQNYDATIKDLINAMNKNINETEEEKTYQWNNFVKDFYKDNNSNLYSNKLKVASILWNELKNSTREKIYTPDLLIKYKDKIKNFIK